MGREENVPPQLKPFSAFQGTQVLLGLGDRTQETTDSVSCLKYVISMPQAKLKSKYQTISTGKQNPHTSSFLLALQAPVKHVHAQ